MAKWVRQPYSLNTASSTVSTLALRGTGWGDTNEMVGSANNVTSCDSLTFSPCQQIQVHVSSSCLEHLACDECWNVHLRRREERRRGEEERRRWREGRNREEGGGGEKRGIEGREERRRGEEEGGGGERGGRREEVERREG